MNHCIEDARAAWSNIKEVLINEGVVKMLNRHEVPMTTHAAVHCASGCTRAAFWTDDHNYVYKLQWTRGYDYGAKELMNYESAVDNHLDHHFAWTGAVDILHCDDRDVIVYAMEYCDVNYDKMSETVYKYQSDAIDGYCGDGADSDDMLSYAESIYDDFDDFQDFLYDNDIGDCHAGNWGYNSNGELVLTDYAGYGLEDSEDESDTDSNDNYSTDYDY